MQSKPKNHDVASRKQIEKMRGETSVGPTAIKKWARLNKKAQD